MDHKETIIKKNQVPLEVMLSVTLLYHNFTSLDKKKRKEWLPMTYFVNDKMFQPYIHIMGEKSVPSICYAFDCSSNKVNVIKNRVEPLHFNSMDSSLWKSQQTVREYEDSAPQHLPDNLCQD